MAVAAVAAVAVRRLLEQRLLVVRAVAAVDAMKHTFKRPI